MEIAPATNMINQIQQTNAGQCGAFMGMHFDRGAMQQKGIGRAPSSRAMSEAATHKEKVHQAMAPLAKGPEKLRPLNPCKA